MRITGALAGAAVAAALLAAPAAEAAVAPGKGIAGVRLGMTQAGVRAVLGRPLRVVRDTTELGPFTQYRYRRLDVIFFRHTRATGIFTTRTLERTARGVGVGSTEAAVLAGVPGATCRGPARLRVCEVGDPSRRGARVTLFDLQGGRVSQVGVYVELRGSEAARSRVTDRAPRPGAAPERWQEH